MQYVSLGCTGLQVSRICLGAMTFGSPEWRPWVLSEEQSRPIIERALEAGINFFDTADMYSRGVSEEILGRALRSTLAATRSLSRRRSIFLWGMVRTIGVCQGSISSMRLMRR